MLKLTKTYTDFNDNERTEDFYFNLTRAELAEMELSEEGGLSKSIEKIMAEQDSVKIIQLFKTIIMSSYGEKSPDGKRFMKKDDMDRPLVNSFIQTEAYSDLFMELSTDAEAATKFVNGIIPKDVSNISSVQPSV